MEKFGGSRTNLEGNNMIAIPPDLQESENGAINSCDMEKKIIEMNCWKK